MSPAFLNFGRHPEPIKSLRRNFEDREQVVQIKEKHWLERLEELEELRDLVYKNINDGLDIQINRFNEGAKMCAIFSVTKSVRRRMSFQTLPKALMPNYNLSTKPLITSWL